jgi:hypothetical protein
MNHPTVHIWKIAEVSPSSCGLEAANFWKNYVELWKCSCTSGASLRSDLGIEPLQAAIHLGTESDRRCMGRGGIEPVTAALLSDAALSLSHLAFNMERNCLQNLCLFQKCIGMCLTSNTLERNCNKTKKILKQISWFFITQYDPWYFHKQNK